MDFLEHLSFNLSLPFFFSKMLSICNLAIDLEEEETGLHDQNEIQTSWVGAWLTVKCDVYHGL